MKPTAMLRIAPLFLLCIFVISDAQALVTASTASPSSRTVTANTPAAFPVTWRLTRAGTLGAATVESAQIVVRLTDSNGAILTTISKSLSKSRIIVDNVEFFTFAETITIPRDVIYKATKAGQRLMVQRIFTDDNFGNTLTAELPVNVAGASSANFSIARMELAFDDGTTACAAKTGKQRTVIATLQTTGTGLLRGTWQIREGGGLNSFRTLRTIQVPVSAGRDTVVQSPALPTGSAGDRLEVRLLIDSPTIDFQVPIISCGISGKDAHLKHPEDNAKRARLLEPAPASPLNTDSHIRWEPVKGAKAYRIEILASEEGEPITAQMVKAKETSAKLSPLTLEKIETNGRYTVRVIAE